MVSLSALLLGCGITSTSSSGGSRLGDAWSLYHNGEYADAADLFQELVDEDLSVAEALCGIGWCRLHLRHPDLSRTAFQSSLYADQEYLDSRVGEAFALRDASVPDDGRLMEQARGSLREAPSYTFSHETRINADDLRVLLAQVFYYHQEFDSCYARCLEVDPAISIAPEDTLSWFMYPNFQSALFAELVRLSELVSND